MPLNPCVLDCFGGQGLVWSRVKKATGIDIKYLGIDKINYGTGFYLPGDNLAYLGSIDLSRFNVVDLDSYGVPYEQLEIVFSRGFIGRVFVTFIQVLQGKLPYGMLEEIGFSREMITKIPTLFAKNGWDYFLEYLAKKGVRQIIHRSYARKHYLTFEIKP